MAILDFIFPKTCLGCKKEGRYICQNCFKKVRRQGWHDGNYSAFRYHGVIRKAIIALKYKHSTEVAKELADYLVKDLKLMHLSSKSYCLIPIPIHWHRSNIRGFNQSAEIGKLIAKEMGWGFTPDLLVKKKATPSQVELSIDQRRGNLKDVFEVNQAYLLPDQDCTVILLDDVFTTGSTLKEVVKVLEKVGIDRIWGLTIAK